MPKQSPETKTTPEIAETLEQRIERLEKENAELRAENEKLKSKSDQGDLKEEIVVNRLYRFGKSKLDKAEVDNILKNLNGEYKNKIEDFIKNDKIEDLQKYLNGLIDSGAINKDQLVNNCMEKGIWLRDGHIFEDGKFGPQTFEAIKCLSSQTGGGNEKSDKKYTIETVGNKKCKIESISSISELPEGYKWDDPENYDESKEDTYPTVYSFVIDGKTYIFYSNGRCKTPEGMKNTEDAVKNLNGESKDENNVAKIEGYEGSLDANAKIQIVKLIKENCADELKISNTETISIDNYGKVSLATGTKRPPTLVSDNIDLKKCLNSDGSFNKGNAKIILKESKESLVKKKKVVCGISSLKEKYGVDGKGISKDTLFGTEYANNPAMSSYLDRYFKLFDDGLIVIDKDSTYDLQNLTIKMELDDDNGNEKFNHRSNNKDLIIDALSIVKDDYSLDEGKFKANLKGIILNIIEREFKK